MILAGQIAVQDIADLRDGLPLKELTSPQVLADDVVRDLPGIPLSAGRGRVPPVRTHLVDNAQRSHHRSRVELSVGHSASFEMAWP